MSAVQTDPGNEWPKNDGTCPVPDISDLTPLSPFYGLYRVLGNVGPRDGKAFAFSVNFIRIVDKLIIDYSLARSVMVAYSNGPNEGYPLLFVAIGHFENCVTDVHRAQRFAKRINKDTKSPTVDLKLLSVFSSWAIGTITEIRNAVEHWYDQIFDGLDPGVLNSFAVKAGWMEINSKRLTYIQLATWIRQLHGLANELAHFCEQNP